MKKKKKNTHVDVQKEMIPCKSNIYTVRRLTKAALKRRIKKKKSRENFWWKLPGKRSKVAFVIVPFSFVKF